MIKEVNSFGKRDLLKDIKRDSKELLLELRSKLNGDDYLSAEKCIASNLEILENLVNKPKQVEEPKGFNPENYTTIKEEISEILKTGIYKYKDYYILYFVHSPEKHYERLGLTCFKAKRNELGFIILKLVFSYDTFDECIDTFNIDDWKSIVNHESTIPTGHYEYLLDEETKNKYFEENDLNLIK